MVLLHSTNTDLGRPLPDFSLQGTDGKTYTPTSFLGAKALVVIFMCNHCPYVQAQWVRFSKLEKDFRTKGVSFIGINPNDAKNYPEDSFEKMKEYAGRYGQEFPYLRDETQEVAHAFGAVCTPDIFVYDGEQKLAYHGRLDDDWKDEKTKKTPELSAALDLIIAGKPAPTKQTPSMGCSIKWKNQLY